MWSPRLGRAKQFFFNWPCNLPQLGWITGENSSLEREWEDWHTADQDEGDEEKKSQKQPNQHQDVATIDLYLLAS